MSPRDHVVRNCKTMSGMWVAGLVFYAADLKTAAAFQMSFIACLIAVNIGWIRYHKAGY